MSNSVEEMRMRLHELVEKGEIFEGIKEIGRYYGFSRFQIGTYTPTYAVDYTLKNGKCHPVNDTLHVGIVQLANLANIWRVGPGLVEREIEHGVGHEAGHIYKPKHPVKVGGKTVPYSHDEIMNSQMKKGKYRPWSKIRKYEIRESQANLYAAVEFRRDRTLDELLDGIATSVWHHAVYIHKNENSILSYFSSHENVVRNATRKYARVAGYSWLNDKALEKISDKVIKIDNEYDKKVDKLMKKSENKFVRALELLAGAFQEQAILRNYV